MNTKHTAGPWDYDRAPQDYDGGGSPAYCTVTAESGEIIIAEVNDKIAEGVANARLIAASPCLLQFAEWATHQFCGDSGTGEIHWEQFPEFVAGQAAIAKATGETP